MTTDMRDSESMEDKALNERKERVSDFIRSQGYAPMGLKGLAHLLCVPKSDMPILRRLVNELCNEGKAFDIGGLIHAEPPQGGVIGTFYARRGYGHVKPDDGGDALFIPPPNRGAAMHMDKVVAVKAVDDRRHDEHSDTGRITQIIKPANIPIVGVLHHADGRRFVQTMSRNMPYKIKLERGADDKGAKDGDIVRAELTAAHPKYRGVIMEVLQSGKAPRGDILAIAASHGIPHKFTDKAMQEADNIPQTVMPHEISNRKDYRGLTTVTIDGEDTKDIDDAISIERLSNGYRLYVHIADVSHYVIKGSALWHDALNRGTSAYLADSVIPMLPESLSNGICSLNPHVDRLTLTCAMEFDDTGRLISHEIHESVIHSDGQLSYRAVSDMLDAGEGGAPYQNLVYMDELADALRARRFKQGSLDFNMPEPKVTLDKRGRTIGAAMQERHKSMQIIEEFMIAANEAVATEFYWRQAPFIYRVHHEPDEGRLREFALFLSSIDAKGLYIKGKKLHIKSLQTILEAAEGGGNGFIISRQLLRSMKQARYSAEAEGHFGLAKAYYSHFTSPIRRFPDLCIHHIIKLALKDGLTDGVNLDLPDIAYKSSVYERRAADCEYDVLNYKQVEYMEGKIGQSFTGVISWIAKQGMYVRLDNGIEGFVTKIMLDPALVYDDRLMQFEGNGVVHKMGDEVNVTVKEAAKDDRLLHFDIVY